MSEPPEVTMQERFPHVTPELLEELDQCGQAIYDKIKSQLEPEHDRKFVAIHVDTEDFVIERNSSSAMRTMLKIHPADGRMFIRKIGNEPEYGLAARVLASKMNWKMLPSWAYSSWKASSCNQR